MKALKRVAPLGLCAITLSGCGYSEDVATIYVLTPLEKSTEFTEASTRFTSELGDIAKQHGLSPSLGRSPGTFGHVYYVIEANGEWLRLWGQNMPISGYESAELCGDDRKTRSDPGQYVVTLDHSLLASMFRSLMPKSAKQNPNRVLEDISKDLVQAGYDVRAEPVECSPLAKGRNSSNAPP